MRLFYIIFFLLFASRINAQSVNKTYIDNWVLKCDSTYKLSKINGYLFEGNLYTQADSAKLNYNLKSLLHTNLLAIDPFWTEEIFPNTNIAGKLIVLIFSRGKQSQKDKEENLKTAISKYPKPQLYQNHIASNSTEPVLLINGKMIFHADCSHKIAAIKRKSIADIYYVKHPVPTEYFGQNAKNGLIQIWTK
jgi:hypothetical protein